MKYYTEIKHKVGSKLFLTGEYAITKENQQAILLHIPKYTYATLQENCEFIIYSDLFGYEVNLNSNDQNYKLILDTIHFIHQYLIETNHKIKKFKLYITSDLYQKDQKYGLGSSGSIVVLLFETILKYHNINLDKLTIFKLIAIFLVQRKDNGSFGDVACILFGQNITYRNFNRNFITKSKSITELLNHSFNTLNIEPLYFPFPIYLTVVWSKVIAISSKLITQISITSEFIEKSAQLFEQYKNVQTFQDFALLIKKNRLLLQSLNDKIEIPELSEICDQALKQNGFAKPSGAGGGDCAIVFTENKIKLNLDYPIIMEVTYESKR